MANVMITYRLKSGVTRETFEAWVRDYDYPNIRGIRRVASFTNHRVERQFGDSLRIRRAWRRLNNRTANS